MYKKSVRRKKNMRKLIQFVALILILFLNTGLEKSFAQGAREFSIVISATVPSTIELLTIQSIDFSGDEIELGYVVIDPIENSSAGRMIARGNPNAEIQINYVRTRELRNIQTNNILVMEYSISGNSIDEQVTSEYLGQEDRDLRFNENGEFYLWIGASVDLSTAEPGNYEGEFSIEVEYI